MTTNRQLSNISQEQENSPVLDNPVLDNIVDVSQQDSKLVNELISLNLDGQGGYVTAAEDLENKDYAALLRTYAAERAKQAAELRPIVRGVGQEPAAEGSIAGSLHQGWINLKAAIGRGDAAILAECEQADQMTLTAYQDVMGQTTNEGLLDVLRQHHFTIKTAYERVKGLRSALEASSNS